MKPVDLKYVMRCESDDGPWMLMTDKPASSPAVIDGVEARASLKLVNSIGLRGNGLDCEVIAERSEDSADACLRAEFILNGKRMAAEHWIRPLTLLSSEAKALAALREEIARVIANEVLTSVFLDDRLGGGVPCGGW